MGSARTVTGVGPRCVFVFAGTGAGGAGTVMSTDNLLGGITATWEGVGDYHVNHNIGNTAYCCQFTAEGSADTDDIFCFVADRGINGVTLAAVDRSGTPWNVAFVHGTIHDGGG